MWEWIDLSRHATFDTADIVNRNALQGYYPEMFDFPPDTLWSMLFFLTLLFVIGMALISLLTIVINLFRLSADRIRTAGESKSLLNLRC